MLGGPDSLVGRALEGRYQVVARIGRGGMGEVYLAEHLMLGSRVALKVLAGERAGDPDAARRFVREARSAFRVDHPHCVRVTDLGAEGPLLYIVMEYLDGRTVGAELDVDGPLSPGRAAHVAAQVAEALAHAHGLGLVHRDLKPDNIMLVAREGDPDFVKVLDFGLSRIFDEHGDLAGTAISLSPLTREGLVFGTPEYMSPEQASGARVGPPSDVYALGAVLHHMLCGEPPFSGQTFTEVLSRQVREAPVAPGLRRPDLGIPPALDALVLACLAKDPARRPASAGALVSELRAVAAAARGASRPVSPVSASETMDLAASRIALAAAGSDRAAMETAPVEPVRADRAARAGWIAAAGAGLAVIVAGVLLADRGGDGDGARGGDDAAAARLAAAPPASDPPTPAAASEPASPVLTAAADPARARSETGGATGDEARGETVAPPAATATAAVPDAGAAPTPRPGARTARQIEAERLVRSAEEARRAGNLLRQLAEADEARRLDPRNRRAVELVGEALVKSGDPARGCPLLRRSRLRRQVGCTD